ncbi:hypothetical protein HK098_000688 [Nowakowskiella sp. JEL0407]|nr:hypothetical protein HK098_000688 [Nowakowskiella sp. JEL0407]
MRNGICHVCESRGFHDHDYSKHKHMITDAETYTVKEEMPSVRSDLTANSAKVDEYNLRIKQLQDKKTQLESERAQLIKTTAKFATFIRQESIVVPNDTVIDYIQMSITPLENIANRTESQENSLTKLRDLKKSYEHQINILKNAEKLGGSTVQTDAVEITAEEVENDFERLYSLELIGSEIKSAIDALKATQTTPGAGIAQAQASDNSYRIVVYPKKPAKQWFKWPWMGNKSYGEI